MAKASYLIQTRPYLLNEIRGSKKRIIRESLNRINRASLIVVNVAPSIEIVRID
jgi:hypothetical protein